MFTELILPHATMFAPVASRFVSYNVKLPEICAKYRDTIMSLAEIEEWRQGAMQEPEEFDELATDEAWASIPRPWIAANAIATIQVERFLRILEFFYRMPQGLINRFYAGRMWPTDYIRMFLGAPPIKIRNALKCVLHNLVEPRKKIADAAGDAGLRIELAVVLHADVKIGEM